MIAYLLVFIGAFAGAIIFNFTVAQSLQNLLCGIPTTIRMIRLHVVLRPARLIAGLVVSALLQPIPFLLLAWGAHALSVSLAVGMMLGATLRLPFSIRQALSDSMVVQFIAAYSHHFPEID